MATSERYTEAAHPPPMGRRRGTQSLRLVGEVHRATRRAGGPLDRVWPVVLIDAIHVKIRVLSLDGLPVLVDAR